MIDAMNYNYVAANLHQGTTITMKKSIFQAHCCVLTDLAQVDIFRNMVLSDRKVLYNYH